MLDYFCEEPGFDPAEFFGILHSFFETFGQTLAKVRRRQASELKQRRLQEQRELQELKKSRAAERGAGSGGAARGPTFFVQAVAIQQQQDEAALREARRRAETLSVENDEL